MAELVPIGLAAGVWEAELRVDGEPEVSVTCRGEALAGVQVASGSGGAWQVRVPVPAEVISDGVQSFVVEVNGAVAGHFDILAGNALAGDLRAEVALLRAELDLLKAAFRRHCAEG